MAKARLDAANQMKIEINSEFAYSNIMAPFNGVITSKNINVGDMANPGAVLLSIENPENFEVIAMVPETEITDIQNGVKVEVVIKSINKTLEGVVSEVSTSAKNSGGQYLVKVTLDSTKANVLSGMFATVQFPVERNTKSTTILIPKKALVTKGQLSGVYTVSQSETALLRWLRLGRNYGDQVEVLSGLNADEVYIVSSEGKLYNGAKIVVQ
jgi:RND family efflux transporter MFP subunit